MTAASRPRAPGAPRPRAARARPSPPSSSHPGPGGSGAHAAGQDVAEAFLLAPLFPGPVRPGPVFRGHRVVRNGHLGQPAGGPGGAELPEAEDHPGVPRAGLLGAPREEGRAGAGGEVR